MQTTRGGIAVAPQLRVRAWFIGICALVLLLLSVAVAAGCLTPSRMAANESAAIAACKTFAEAQKLYHRTDWDKDGVLEYARAITGANSLYEEHAGRGDRTLVDTAFAQAAGAPGVVQPKAGYVFRILMGQGPAAPGGRKSYLVDCRMTQGFALVVCPASYDGTGRNTFILSDTGIVYQEDLGPDTVRIVNAMTEYDPGSGWVAAE
ncbi:MAG: DUF2950 family protein [Planctomycetes bacterium]|nr:DUF2950 family protein [Planctomycetota bacterium]